MYKRRQKWKGGEKKQNLLNSHRYHKNNINKNITSAQGFVSEEIAKCRWEGCNNNKSNDDDGVGNVDDWNKLASKPKQFKLAT